MNEVIKKLDEAYKLVSSLSVSGDAVDVVAVVRSHLRDIHAELTKKVNNIGSAPEPEKEDVDG